MDKINEYHVIRKLGAGGMGEVYEALAPDGSHVALKVFSAACASSRFLKARFQTEGRLLQRLRHPRLVHVYESGIDANSGQPYYAMELVFDQHGHVTTLHDVIKHSHVTEARAETWFADLCSVVSYCHEQGIVHRDIKLGNVLLNAEGRAVLSDFGVSRIVKPDLRDELHVETTFVTGQTTGTRPVMGTYWYLAPELRRGDEATCASDWYALGVLFYRLLTGMWYERGTAALDLLAPLNPIWRMRLGSLLSDDPAKRHPILHQPHQRTTRNLLLGASAVLIVFITLTACWINGNASSRRPADQPTVLTYDATNQLAFCRCPSGTNLYNGLSIRITYPYELGKTPVTRRQWFAVHTKPLQAWQGGEDAPMTYVSYAEITNFCALLNRRFAARLPKGYEIRLPTLAEWCLAYAQGHTMPPRIADEHVRRQTYAERGWFGQGVDGEAQSSNMRLHYETTSQTTPRVTNIWHAFPPRVIRAGQDDWARYSSQIPPVPVGLKPANELGLCDMLGNCFERMEDTCSEAAHNWGQTEWGACVAGLYQNRGSTLTNPIERSGTCPLMIGCYMAPDIPGDSAWSSLFDRMPHLGFRLCIGPRLTPSAQHIAYVP